MEFDNLSKDEKFAFWSEIEGRIKTIMSNIGRSVAEADQEEVSKLLSHNELGIALEHLSNALIEDEIKIEKNIRDEILDLMKLMEYDSKDIQYVENNIETT